MRRLIVCGGRAFFQRDIVDEALDYFLRAYGVFEIVEGGATGADTLARQWARRNGISVMTIPAQWAKYGRAAGPLRNEAMAKLPGVTDVLAFPGGTGTQNMIEVATVAGLHVWRARA